MEFELVKFMYFDGMDGLIWFVWMESVNIFFFWYFGIEEFNLNGQVVFNDCYYVFYQGLVICII